ncbi:Peptidyl-prolyl cis-trans isomerase FKBP4, partial [Fragariocoptes setiger]
MATMDLQSYPFIQNKKIIREGEGDEHPEDGHEVSVHYVGKFLDGQEFDSSRSRGTPFSFTLGEGSVIKGWDLALRTMRRNETASFEIPPEYAYGEAGSPPTIPPNSTLVFEIELLDWVYDDSSKERPIYQMSMAERRDKCEDIKNRGATYFSQGKYDLAIKQYRNIMKLAGISELREDGDVVNLDSAEGMPPENETQKRDREALRQMMLAGHLNLALCYLKLGNHQECIQNCNDALKFDSNNVKALFRKGKSYFTVNEYETALPLFEKVLELDPNNVEAKNQIAACRQALKAYHEKEKNMYKNLFSKR